MELYLLLAVVAVFFISVFLLKLPAGVSLMLAAVSGSLLGGYGVPVRHLVEGTFGFLEAMMIIATAMVFMKVVSATGALSTISYGIIRSFNKYPTLLIILLFVFVMSPGMLTGLSSACILTTGALVLPALIAMGMPRLAAGAFIAIAAVLGEIAPPISIPVMIIGGGVDMPYIGFTGPLLLATMPLAVVFAMVFRYRYIKSFNVEEVLARLEQPVYTKYGSKLFIPVLLVVGYLIAELVFPRHIPHLGIPLVFMLGALAGLGTGKKFNIITQAREGLRAAVPVLSILAGVGMFLQVLTLTGVRGYVAVSALALPDELKYLMAFIMPFFGSAYGSASVIGVPLVYVFIGKSAIVVSAALSLLAALGDLMPPPSLLCAYAAQMIDEPNHFKVLRTVLPYLVATLVWALVMIYYAGTIASWFGV